MRRKRRRSNVSLPWEQQTRWLSGALSGPRWRIVVVIAGVGLAVTLLYVAATHALRDRTTRAAIDEVHRATASFMHDHGRCPSGLGELLDPPEGRRYLREAPSDGWGRPLWFACPGHFHSDRADVVSAGPSGSFFSDDNVR